MKIKTLKDLKFVNNPNPICKTIKSELKEEAIKWVKKMKSDIPEGENPQHIKDIINGLNGAINVFSKFFNITEEELE